MNDFEEAIERDWRAYTCNTADEVSIPSHFREGWVSAYVRLIPWLKAGGPFNAPGRREP